MHFLADENFPHPSIYFLLQNHISIAIASYLFSGKPDTFILENAVIQNQIIITFDKDFGDLVFQSGLPSPKGIILFRLKHYLPDTPGKMLLGLIQNGYNFSGFFTVITEQKIRQTILPLALNM